MQSDRAARYRMVLEVWSDGEVQCARTGSIERQLEGQSAGVEWSARVGLLGGRGQDRSAGMEWSRWSVCILEHVYTRSAVTWSVSRLHRGYSWSRRA
jgi:hypothetical protein